MRKRVLALVMACMLVAVVFAGMASADDKRGESAKSEIKPIPNREIRVKGTFYGVWGYYDDSGNANDTDNENIGGWLRGVYGVINYPLGIKVGVFKGVWNAKDGEKGFVQGRCTRDGHFYGTWKFFHSPKGGTVQGSYGMNEEGRYFIGDWKTYRGDEGGYLRGTWTPFVKKVVKGEFEGEWGYYNDTDAIAGYLSGLYGRAVYIDGREIGVFRGEWNSTGSNVTGILKGVYANGHFYGIWKCNDPVKRGFVYGVYDDDSFSGTWFYADGTAMGFLQGNYYPFNEYDTEITP